LPDINNEASISATIPANITIINNDYSQINYNNYYMSKQRKQKKKHTFEERLAQRVYIGRDIPSQRMTPPEIKEMR